MTPAGAGGCSRQFPSLLGIAILLQVLVTCRATLICNAVMKVSPQNIPEYCQGTLLSATSHGSKNGAGYAGYTGYTGYGSSSQLCPQQQAPLWTAVAAGFCFSRVNSKVGVFLNSCSPQKYQEKVH